VVEFTLKWRSNDFDFTADCVFDTTTAAGKKHRMDPFSFKVAGRKRASDICGWVKASIGGEQDSKVFTGVLDELRELGV
jgi:hypothetical protein